MLIMTANNLLMRRLHANKIKISKSRATIYKTTHLFKNIYCNEHLMLTKGLFAKATFLKLN